jgi:queuosine precursor transporter
MKIRTQGRWLWSRIIGSTLCGELVDSGIFYLVAFYGRMPIAHLLAIMFTQYLLKSGWEIVAAPLTYRVVAFLKKAEHEDYYDIGTNFTPFSLKT